jgi:hypothetical protein
LPISLIIALARDFFGGIGRLNGRINAVIAELNALARRRQMVGVMMPPGLLFDLVGEGGTVRTSSIEGIRWAFFLLIFSESQSLSFFPIFVTQFYDPAFALPLPAVIGIPITVFMLVWAITMPPAGTWCDRIGYRLAVRSIPIETLQRFALVVNMAVGRLSAPRPDQDRRAAVRIMLRRSGCRFPGRGPARPACGVLSNTFSTAGFYFSRASHEI